MREGHGLKPAGQKGGPDDQRGRLIGRTKGGLNTKLHAVTPSRGLPANHCRAVDAKGRPLKFFMTAGQVSDYTGAAALLGSLPGAEWLIADRGYDADWFREALKDKGIKPCIPGRKSRGKPVRYDKRRYKRRNRIEIMFGRLKDWRRVATRYDRCAKTFLSAVALAATVLFWLWRSMSLDPKAFSAGFLTCRHAAPYPKQEQFPSVLPDLVWAAWIGAERRRVHSGTRRETREKESLS